MQVIGRNIFSLGLSRISSGVILFVVQAKLASYLGPHGFGKFSLVLAFQTIFLLFVDAGISRYVVKKISEDRSAAPHYYGNFLMAQFFMAALVFLVFISLPKVFNYDSEITKAMLFAGAGLFFTGLSIPSVTIVQAWQKIHIFAAIIFIESLIKAGWFAYAILRNLDLVFIFQVYLAVGVFDLLVWLAVTKKIAVPKFAIDTRMVRTMFLFGVPFAMVSGFEMLIAKIDVVIQKVFLPYSDVGLYSAAYRFLDFLTFLPAIVAISLFPYFSEKRDLNNSETKNVINQINRYMMALAIPLGVAVTVLADKIILTLFGSGYTGSILPFQILIWSTSLTLLYAVPNVIMQVRQTRKAVAVLAFATVLNAVLNWLLVPLFGIVASAWLTVLSYLAVTLFYMFYSRKLAQFELWRFAGWPAAAAAVMGVILWQIKGLNIFLLTLLALFIYFGILGLAGFIRKEDWKFLKSIFQKEPTS